MIGVDAAYTSKWGAQHWRNPLQQQTSDPVTRHHAAAAAIGRRGLGMAIKRRPTGPAPDSGPLRAHHRPGPITTRAPHAGAVVPTHRHTHLEVWRSTGQHPPAATNTVRPAQDSLLLSNQERSVLTSASAHVVDLPIEGVTHEAGQSNSGWCNEHRRGRVSAQGWRTLIHRRMQLHPCGPRRRRRRLSGRCKAPPQDGRPPIAAGRPFRAFSLGSAAPVRKPHCRWRALPPRFVAHQRFSLRERLPSSRGWPGE